MNFTNRFGGVMLAAALLVGCGSSTPTTTDESQATPVVEITTESVSAEPETETEASNQDATTEEPSTEETESEESATEDAESEESATEDAESEESATEEISTEEASSASTEDASTASTEDTSTENASTDASTSSGAAGGGASDSDTSSEAGGGATIDKEDVPELPTLGDNAITTESGLQYEDAVVGEGEAAQNGDIVTVHYAGYLEDGTVFDSSIPRGTPFAVSLGAGRVIPGWEEGLLDMKVGGTRTLVIPSELAYGEQGRSNIPPNSTLIFSVEVLDIQAKPEPAAVSEYTTLESGVEIAILEEGEAQEAAKGDIVKFDYNAWIEEGNVLFDSSAEAGRPASLPLGQSGLQGLDLGMEGIKSGETRQIRIPPELAYGEEGAGNVIPPNATLIFEIRLLEVKLSPKLSLADEADFTATESGLEYAILEEGDGEVVKSGDNVSVHYSGWLEDGTLFDSSVPRDAPFPFVVGAGDVIAGWDEGLEGMKVGETRQLRIPSALGYGAQGSPPVIPPDATLIFDVQLLQIDPPSP
ncbi:MAG: FKBP-type peptidyl-prolyl cis-trans isomerase [Ardenticatenaceae bacterium]